MRTAISWSQSPVSVTFYTLLRKKQYARPCPTVRTRFAGRGRKNLPRRFAVIPHVLQTASPILRSEPPDFRAPRAAHVQPPFPLPAPIRPAQSNGLDRLAC